MGDGGGGGGGGGASNTRNLLPTCFLFPLFLSLSSFVSITVLAKLPACAKMTSLWDKPDKPEPTETRMP